MLKRPNDPAKYPAYLRKIGEHAIADELEKRVEVVHCKDCGEYHQWLRGKICMRLGSYYGYTKPDDFCSCGRRKDVEVEG
jgi:ribosomal protein L32